LNHLESRYVPRTNIVGFSSDNVSVGKRRRSCFETEGGFLLTSTEKASLLFPRIGMEEEISVLKKSRELTVLFIVIY